MKPTLKINFVDFWPVGFDPYNNFFYKLLSTRYNVELTENPDFIIYSCYGNKYLRYNCTRLFYTAENLRPDFTACDYAIGFDYIQRDNYLRVPLYVLYCDGDFSQLSASKPSPEEILRSKTGFCNMVVSNPHSKRRIQFFEKLSKYKKVDSGGKHLNNIGGPVADKRAFVRKYKFSLAFENSSFPGYTTEKILEPMQEYSMPLYWGNPLVGRDFNTRSFLNYHDYNSDEAFIERIIELDKNDDLYLQYLREPYVTRDLDAEMGPEVILSFIQKIKDNIGHQAPVATTYKRHIHEIKRKSFILQYELRKKLGLKNFR
jgi:alpha(1,3/1,4) fucosyltransferase